MRPPRLFNLMLTAFALVIVLGISGWHLRSGWSGPEQPRTDALDGGRGSRTYSGRSACRLLSACRFVARVERQLGPLPQGFGSIEGAVSLLDENGRVVAGRRRPMILRGNEAVLRIPIVVNNQQVGTLVISVIDTDEAFPVGNLNRRPLLLGMLSAGAGLMAVLLVLAAIFSRQISTLAPDQRSGPRYC